MGNLAVDAIHFSWSRLNRRPMLTAMMVYVVGFGMVIAIAACAFWRSSYPVLPSY